MQLLMSLRNGDKYEPVVLLDDDPMLLGTVFQGVQVHAPSKISEILSQKKVEQVVLAIPSASMWRRKEILHFLEPLPVRVRTVPSVEQLLGGEAKVEQVRDVEIEDLLGRDPVAPNMELLRANVSGKSVMVTGAGGSIGSELSRQIVQSNPSRTAASGALRVFALCYRG